MRDRSWLLAIVVAVLCGGGLLFAQPLSNYCGYCEANLPAWYCLLAGCW